MKTTLLRSRTTEKPLENDDCGTGCRPWIIENAGELEFATSLSAGLEPSTWARMTSYCRKYTIGGLGRLTKHIIVNPYF